MSNALAIAAVTAALKNQLYNGLAENDVAAEVGEFSVTALPPDRIPIQTGAEKSQLNLFMYQVSPNSAMRNLGLPSRDDRGECLSNPPLAVDLHYLLSAYGARELDGEILLGWGMQILHETAVLSRAAIRRLLAPNPGDPSTVTQALAEAELADQMELIKITPQTLSAEELSKLWSALQAHYRPTAAYQASVVLIQSQHATREAPPVLFRGPVDKLTNRERGVVANVGMVPPYPALTSIEPPLGQTVARLGETVTLSGHHLDGMQVVVRFEHRQLDEPIELILLDTTKATSINVTLPNTSEAQIEWPAGLYSVSISLLRPGDDTVRTTNAIAMWLAPLVDIAATTITRDPQTQAVSVDLRFTPQARPGQRIALNIAGREAFPQPFAAAADRLEFVFPKLPAGKQWARLRVDGADSVTIDRSGMPVEPPKFDKTQQLEIPA